MKDNKKVEKKNQTKKSGSNFFVRAWNWLKTKVSGMVSELKKVTWPGFSKVLKQTGVVIAVVLFFLVIVTAIDFGLTELIKLAQ